MMLVNCYSILVTCLRGLLALAAIGLFSGCQESAVLRVIPMSGSDVCSLGPEAIIKVMREAGFSDDQIVELGTEVRNNLATWGAVQILEREKTRAILVAEKGYVYVCCDQRGASIFDAQRGAFIPTPLQAVCLGQP